MNISEYQEWVRHYDAERGFDHVKPSQTLAHALEELGEVAREVLFLDGYRDDEHPQERRQALAEELSDTFVFLFKLANYFQIDMETALKDGQNKAHERYSVEEGRLLTARYRQRQQARHKAE